MLGRSSVSQFLRFSRCYTTSKREFVNASLLSFGINAFRNFPNVTELSNVLKFSPLDLQTRINRLATTVQAANWADHIVLAQNLSLWESELNTLQTDAKSLMLSLSAPASAGQLEDVAATIECLKSCATVRDHVIELLQFLTHYKVAVHDDTRAPVSVEPHCKAVEKAYEELLRQYPTLAPKIDETVGQALALLRQCVRFDFKAQQRFFF